MEASFETDVDISFETPATQRVSDGERPFPGPSVESALNRLTKAPEMPLDLPTAWWVLLSEMTARSPEERPSALEVSERLTALRGASDPARLREESYSTAVSEWVLRHSSCQRTTR